MIREKSTRILLLFFLILFVSVIFSFYILPHKSEAPAIISSLVTPEALTTTASILIENADTPFQIELKKKEGKWWLYLGEKRYPAREEAVNLFLTELTKKRPIQKVHSKDTYRYAIGQKGSYSVRLTHSNGTIISDLLFGATDAEGSGLYVQTGVDRSILRIADTISPSLVLKTAYWAELSIFSTQLARADIQRVVYEKNGIQKVYRAGSDIEVQEVERILEALRCIDITNIPSSPEEKLYIELGDNTTLQFGLSKLTDTDLILSDEKSGASYIISTWTKERIDRCFSKP